MRINAGMVCLIVSLTVVASVEAQGGRGRGGGGRMGPRSIFSTADNEAVQKEINASSDVVGKIKTINEDYRSAVRADAGERPDFRSASREEQTKYNEKYASVSKTQTEKFLPKLKDVLTAEQFTRLQQINWQAEGTTAYQDSEVIKSLSIAQDQQTKIDGLRKEYDGKFGELFAGGAGGGGGEAFSKMRDLRTERDAKINEVLTKDQHDKFASLIGKKFDTDQLGGFGRGGGGNGGGGGGGRQKKAQSKSES